MNSEINRGERLRTGGLDFEVFGRPEFAYLRVILPPGQTLSVEASAMASMDTHIKMQTQFKGGLSRMLRGESLFLNRFTPQGAPGVLELAPGPPGDLQHYYLQNETLFLQASSYVASTEGVKTYSKWQGFGRGFFSGAGLFLVKCEGTGDLWFNSFGGIFEIDVKGGTVVDNGHVVAFTEGLTYKIDKIGGYKSLFLSKEGLVCRFSGQGKVWVQNRQVPAFTRWVNPFRRVKKQKS